MIFRTRVTLLLVGKTDFGGYLYFISFAYK